MATQLKHLSRKATQQLPIRPSQWTRPLSSTPAPLGPEYEQAETLPPIDLSALPSIAHADLETHREIRSLARKAAWEMPLLASLSKPFEPPTAATPLRWRYTTYMGEQHPASRKVVLEFSPNDLPDLNDKQKIKLAKLAGARWNPVTEVVKMSCESFETQAQNKRFLGETVGKLVAEARDGTVDGFEDVPLDTRHITNKRMLRKQKALVRARLRRSEDGFPAAWRMTPQRKAELEARRGRGEEIPTLDAPKEASSQGEGAQTEEETFKQMSEQFAKENAGAGAGAGAGAEADPVPVPAARGRTVISGLEAIEEARRLNLNKVEEPVMAEARQPMPKGKQGQKSVGQRGRPK